MKRLNVLLTTAIIVLASCGSLQAQERLNQITKRGVIKVGMTGEQPPFNMLGKDGKLIGYEVDLAEMLAESMGLELELVTMPFQDLLPAVPNGKVDVVMSGMTITMERNLKVAFIGPYIISGKSFVTKTKSLAKVEEVGELDQSKLRISFLKGSTSEAFVRTLLPEAKALPAANYDAAVKALLSAEANIMVADYPICALTALQNPSANLVVLDEPLTIEPIGMALPPEDPLLMNFVQNYFNALSMAGVLDRLEQYWFEDAAWLEDSQ